MLYGRDSERARIGELLRAAHDSQAGVLVLQGEPGVGKSALLQDARERASGMEVLWARGVESESELPFAALHQPSSPSNGRYCAWWTTRTGSTGRRRTRCSSWRDGSRPTPS